MFNCFYIFYLYFIFSFMCVYVALNKLILYFMCIPRNPHHYTSIHESNPQTSCLGVSTIDVFRYVST
jgi:hypothetical protein